MSIHCSSTVVWDISGQLPAVRGVGRVSPRHCVTKVAAALWDGADSDTVSGKLRKGSQKSGSNSLFLYSTMLGCRAAGQWARHDVKTTNYHQHEAVFFTLYILSIFTHKMYMIGMHIIFLLTDSFNKALCQSAAMVSTFCLLCGIFVESIPADTGQKTGKSWRSHQESNIDQVHTCYYHLADSLRCNLSEV